MLGARQPRGWPHLERFLEYRVCIPSLADIAAELGPAPQTVRRARMDPSSPNYRPAASGWEKVVAKLARERAGELLKLAEELEG